ncbi:MAG: nucleotidyltransferase domain-containing protein [Dehalococcoidia bacterium]
MVATAEAVRSIVLDFVQRLEALAPLRVQRVLLFGSYAHGWPHRGSDIDLVVVSEGFRRMGRHQRLDLLVRAAYASDHRIEAIAVTPGELRRAGPGTFLGEVKRTGVVVYEAP